MGEVTHDDALSITRAAKELAHDRNVTAIAVFTQTGRTAHLMAKSRPSVPILAFTPLPNTYRRLAMFWGVVPCLVHFANSLEEMLGIVEKAILSFTQIQAGQQVVFISGFPVGALCPPNLALLIQSAIQISLTTRVWRANGLLVSATQIRTDLPGSGS
jgi:pyruvate kinase